MENGNTFICCTSTNLTVFQNDRNEKYRFVHFPLNWKKGHIPFAGWHINWEETYYTPPLLWLLAFCFISSLFFVLSFSFMNFHSPTPISIFSFNASCWNSPMAIFLSCFVDLGVQERIRIEVGIVFRWGYFVSLCRNQVRCRVTVLWLVSFTAANFLFR